MFDRALYMRSVIWDNEQVEKANEEAEARRAYNESGEPPPRQVKVAPRKQDPDEVTVSDTKVADEDVVALWDGSMEGLRIFKPITMLPPKSVPVE